MAVLDHYVQGYFTSDGTAKSLNIPTGIDFIEVDNLTIGTTPATGTGFRFTWQRGMAAGSAIQYTATTTTGAMQVAPITSGGFTLLSTGGVPTMGSQLSGTAISNATPPVASSANTGSLAVGNLVQLYNTVGARQFGGYYFTVTAVTPNTSFTLGYAPTIVAGTTFNYRIISSEPQYYPRNRLITAITSNVNINGTGTGTYTLVKFSATHGLTVGQELVFNIPAVFGMIQLNGQRGKITSISTANNTVTVDIDTVSYSAFVFPLTATAAAPYTPAQAIPFGDGTDQNPFHTSAVLDGATQNTAVNGMLLGSGANGPAGQSGNVIFWRAWKAEQLQTS